MTTASEHLNASPVGELTDVKPALSSSSFELSQLQAPSAIVRIAIACSECPSTQPVSSLAGCHGGISGCSCLQKAKSHTPAIVSAYDLITQCM